MKDRKLRVFLCHASQDKPVVRELYQRLLAEEWIDPWLDEKKLITGQNWDVEIEKAVELSDAVIVFLSNHSITKEGYVQKELRRILDKAEEKPEDVIFIIPLRLEECTPPRRLKPYQYQDYFPTEKQRKDYILLKNALKTRFKQLVSREKKEVEKVNKEKAKQIARIRAQKTRDQRKAQKLKEESDRKKAEELARKEAEKEKAFAQKKAQEEAEVLAKKLAEEKTRKAAEELVHKAEEALGRKWTKGRNLLDQVEIFSFPHEIIKKRITFQEIIGWVLSILVFVLMVMFTSIISQYAAQSGGWGGNVLLLTWICFGSFLALIIIVTIVSSVHESIGSPDSKKVRYTLPMGNDIIFLNTNGILGKLNLATGEASVLKSGLYKRKRFVLISNNQKIVFDNGIIFNLIEKREVGKLKSFKDHYFLWDFDPSRRIFLVEYLRDVIVMDFDTNEVLEEFTSRHILFKSLLISREGDLVLALCSVKDPKTDKYYSDVQVWKRGHGEYLHTIPSFAESSVSVKLSADGKVLAIAGDGKVVLYSLIENKKFLEYKIEKKKDTKINCLMFIANNKFLVASLTNQMLVLDTETGNNIYIPLTVEDPASHVNIDDLFYLTESGELLGVDKQVGKLYKWKL